MKTQFIKCLLTLAISLVITSVYAQEVNSDRWSAMRIQSKIDSLLPGGMEANEIPGFAYVIVKDDSVFLSGGAGYANLSTQTKVSPQTMFMMGSNAKPITATAVMQLFEKGLIDLDKDVNTYLKSFQLSFSVTLRQLLTHTGGLEDQSFNRVRLSASEMLSLSDYLSKRMPKQVFTPGEVGAYSNHGVALAGLVVEEVSGLSFEQYAQKFIFAPLKMSNSTFDLDRARQGELAFAYRGNQALQQEYVFTTPASMLISTVSDMGKFMISHLNSGQELLAPETTQIMHQQHFTHNPAQPGRALGLFEDQVKGNRSLVHGGSRAGFVSYLHMVPEEKIGVYVAYNGGSSRFRTAFIDVLMNDLLDEVAVSIPAIQKPSAPLSDYVGDYYTNRRNETSIERLVNQFMTGGSSIQIASDTTLLFSGAIFYARGKDLFSTESGSFFISFGRDKSGAVKYLHLPGRGDAHQKFHWYQNEKLHAGFLILALVAFLFISIRAIIHRIKKKQHSKLRMIFNWHAMISAVFLLSLTITLALLGQALEYDTPIIFYAIFTLPILGILALGYTLIRFYQDWKSLSRKQRLWNVGHLVLSFIFTFQLYFWNFLGYNF